MSPLRAPLKHLDDEQVDERRVNGVWRRLQRSRTSSEHVRARPRPALLVVAAAIALLGLGVWRWSLGSDSARAPLSLADGRALTPRVVAEQPTNVTLSDGSTLRLEAGAEMLVLVNQSDTVQLVQRRGRVTFDVESTGRRWRIDAGEASVEVLGTTFTIVRQPGTFELSVQEGAVLVRSDQLEDGVTRVDAGGSLRLGEGSPQQQEVPPPAAAELARTSEDTLSERVEPSREQISSGALLQAADRARRDGRMEAAERLLGRVVARRDGRSAVAAFTLARIQQASRPRQAAIGFSRSIELGLAEPLRRAAFERRIEAQESAGLDSAEARRLLRAAYQEPVP